MKARPNRFRFAMAAYQHGVATLAVSLVILFLVTMVTLYTARTSIMEQKVSANLYRSEQAFAAASGALEYGVAYYDAGGVDHNENGVVDSVDPADDNPFSPPLTITSPDGSLTTTAELYFCDPTDLVPNCGTLPLAADDDEYGKFPAGMVAVGYSDDGTARHVMSLSVGNEGLLGDGPTVPLITESPVTRDPLERPVC